ncbi:hypothetical protein ACFPU0_21075 [Pseudomonas sp. GCM10022186]|uniref:hypothetical protein n=1 Tax=Pseudomonas sp. GCM10022186 TaxID=3252650 RepID=UPI00360C638F
MQDAYTPIVFQRHTQHLRAVMIDNRPWFVAYDFARLIAAPRAHLLARRMAAHDDPALRDEPSWKRMPLGD